MISIHPVSEQENNQAKIMKKFKYILFVSLFGIAGSVLLCSCSLDKRVVITTGRQDASILYGSQNTPKILPWDYEICPRDTVLNYKIK